MNHYNKNNAAIGARIREIRLQKHLTQEELAERANISNPQQVSNIERGLSGISINKLQDICRALEVSSDYILFGITANNIETVVHEYLALLTDTQATTLIDIIKAYAKGCGISI